MAPTMPPASPTLQRRLRHALRRLLLRSGLRTPDMPSDLGMASFQKRASWELQRQQCPCDLHLVEYLRDEKVTGKNIFHFGTGAHHVVGQENAKLSPPNEILGITAASREHATYVDLVVRNPSLAKSYKVLFADIYTLTAGLLPRFDLVTLFHLCEYHLPENSQHTHHDDTSLLRMLLGQLQPGGRALFFSQSFAWAKTKKVVAAFEQAGTIRVAGQYKSLLVTQKMR